MPVKDVMIIFDLDGTLWDSAANVAASWNCVLEKQMPEKAGISAQDVHDVMGKPMDEILRILFPDEGDEQRLKIGAACFMYENEYLAQHGGVLFEGVEETLEGLLKDGYKLAVVSNCQKGYIPAFFKSMDMQKYFCDYEEWGRTGLDKGSNIRLVMQRNGFEKAVYVGDTKGDEAATRKADLPFIHAQYGFGDADSPDAVLLKFSDLPHKIDEALKKRS